MDSSIPFQPWTSADDSINVKDERPSSGDGKPNQHDKNSQEIHLPTTSGIVHGQRLGSEHSGDASGYVEETHEVAEDLGDSRMNPDKIERMQYIVENTLSAESKQRITELLEQVDLLNGAEKLLLYLKLPTGAPLLDPLKHPLNPLGSRSEIQHTVMWIQTHLEVDPEVSLPKQDVYDEYIAYCMSTQMKPLSTADFGKVMKQVYPCVKPRRLGTRGNSRYCYAGMRKRVKLEVPQLPDLGEKPKTIEIPFVQNELLIAASQLIREWSEKLLNIKFINLCDLAQYLVNKNLVDTSSAMALSMMNAPMEDDSRQTVSESDIGSPSTSKSPRSGVIRQLKRKIQSQPHPVPTKFYGKRFKLTSISEEQQSENPQPGSSGQSHSPHIKAEVAPSPPEQIVSHHLATRDHLIRAQKPIYPMPDSHSNLQPGYSINQPYDRLHAVNLSQQQSYDTRQYYTPTNPEQYKPSISRQPDYHESYKYNPYYIQDMSVPHNLSMSTFMNPTNCPTIYPAEKYGEPSSPHHPTAGCLPINLSSSSTQEYSTVEDYYKSINTSRIQQTEPIAQTHSHNVQLETLNLTVGSKHNDWSNNPPPSRPKLPLPGKKMILEAYNNENQLQSTQTHATPDISNKFISPGKDMSAFNDEYRPKKMRASENFGGKLPVARLSSITSQTFDLHGGPMDKLEDDAKATVPSNETHASDISSLPQSSSLQESGFTSMTSTSEAFKGATGDNITNSSIPEQHDESKNFIVNTVTHSSHGTIVSSLQRPTRPYQRGVRGGSKMLAYCPVDNIVISEEPKSTKPCRGRPRKKSLTKAKYTRRQPKVGKQPCVHHGLVKRSSDSCCSLSEESIKTICKEKHSEILNRERVISICNIDKHALDDYLNEGNSQEHEEELMQYFQNNTDDQIQEDVAKTSSIELKEDVDITDTKQFPDDISADDVSLSRNLSNLAKNFPSVQIESKANNSQTLTGNFLDSNLDLHDEHSQGKSEKISQLRELLEKNLIHPQAAVSSQLPVSAGLDMNIESIKTSLESKNTVAPISGNGESAFKSLNGRNVTISSSNFNQTLDFKEGSAAASLTLLSQRQQNKANEKPTLMNASSLLNRGLNARRRVSFETPIIDSNASCNINLANINRGRQSVPQSPTFRTQHFSFMPISPGPHSPISNKNSPIGNLKQLSPNKTFQCGSIQRNSGTTSPVTCTTIASPFVSPRNTPVPRARSNCQLKLVPNRLTGKKSKLCGNKSLKLSDGNNLLHSDGPYNRYCGNFAVPNEQNCTQRFHSCKVRNLPMSAPPSPNILMPRYKPYYSSQNNNTSQNSSTDNCNRSLMQDSNMFQNVTGLQLLDSPSGDQAQPSSADPLSSEVSQFFSDCLLPAPCDPGGSFRSQSAPLNKNLTGSEGNLMLYDQQCGDNNAVMGFLSYQNTPCNSIPPTPIPAEFCDFGNLNETCESISKAGLNSESLDKIYNILDSNPQDTLQGRLVAERNSLKNSIENSTLSNGDLQLSTFTQEINGSMSMESVMTPNASLDSLLPQSAEMTSTIDSMFQNQSQDVADPTKRSERVEFDLTDISDEKKTFSSRSVPSTPLPFRKATMTSLNINKYNNENSFHYFSNDYERSCSKNIISKSVPSTPLIPDDRSVFSYSNRDFLINGNSVDVNVSSSYVDSITPTSDSLKQDFLNETDSLMSNGKGNASLLGDMEESPLQGIVNTELVSFNDECISIGPDLQTFNEQGISNENDLLQDLDKIDTVTYNTL